MSTAEDSYREAERPRTVAGQPHEPEAGIIAQVTACSFYVTSPRPGLYWIRRDPGAVRPFSASRSSVALAARPQPPLIQAQDVAIARSRPIADVRQHVDDGDEFLGQFAEDIRKGVVVACQAGVRVAAQGDVVVHVHEATLEAVAEKAGKEERVVRDVAQVVARRAALGRQRARQSQTPSGSCAFICSSRAGDTNEASRLTM